MKIKEIEIGDLEIQPVVPLTISYGTFDVLEYVLVKVTVDDGTIGYGEGAPDFEVTGETRDDIKEGLESIKGGLIGRDPFDIEAIIAFLMERLPSSPTAWAALDMALFDLMGKSLNIPVYRLLGGKYRKEISFVPTIPLDEPEVMAKYAEGIYLGGFMGAKIKLGTTLEEDIERVKRITEAAPGIELTPDVNQGWGDAPTAMDAIGALEKLKNINIKWIEQPTKAGDLKALAEVKMHSPFPIMVDEGCLGPEDAVKVIEMGAADIVNIKLMKAGGLYRATKLYAVCEAAGIPTIVGSMLESSLGSAAGMHLTAAKRGILACESIGPAFLKKDIGTGFVVDFERKVIPVPEGPGLGVEIE